MSQSVNNGIKETFTSRSLGQIWPKSAVPESYHFTAVQWPLLKHLLILVWTPAGKGPWTKISRALSSFVVTENKEVGFYYLKAWILEY